MEIKQDRLITGSEAFSLAMQAAHELSDSCNRRVLVQSNYSIIYAKEDDLTVGCITFFFFNDSCFMPLAYVAEGHRRRGIFKAMFSHLREYCKKNGMKNIEWSSHVSNTGANAAYSAMAIEPTHYTYYIRLEEPLK